MSVFSSLRVAPANERILTLDQLALYRGNPQLRAEAVKMIASPSIAAPGAGKSGTRPKQSRSSQARRTYVGIFILERAQSGIWSHCCDPVGCFRIGRGIDFGSGYVFRYRGAGEYPLGDVR